MPDWGLGVVRMPWAYLARTGMTVDQYVELRQAGLRRCNTCERAAAADQFCGSFCRDCWNGRRRKERPVPVEERGVRAVAARMGLSYEQWRCLRDARLRWCGAHGRWTPAEGFYGKTARCKMCDKDLRAVRRHRRAGGSTQKHE